MDFFKGLFNALAITFTAAFVIFLICMLVSCRTKYVAVPEYHERYTTRTDSFHSHTRDSIIIRDSVAVLQWTKGDTVYISRDRWHAADHHFAEVSKMVLRDTVIIRDTATTVLPATKTDKRSSFIPLCFLAASFLAIAIAIKRLIKTKES